MPEAPKSLLLRAVLVGLSPIVARVLSVPDSLSLEELHEVMLLLLGWESHPSTASASTARRSAGDSGSAGDG